MQAKIIERQKQIELQEQENLRVQRRLEATIKKQAEAKETFQIQGSADRSKFTPVIGYLLLAMI